MTPIDTIPSTRFYAESMTDAALRHGDVYAIMFAERADQISQAAKEWMTDHASAESAAANESEFGRRAWIRSRYSYLESTLNFISALAEPILLNRMGRPTADAVAELLGVRDQKSFLGDDGNVKLNEMRASVRGRFLFLNNLVDRWLQRCPRIDKASNEWQKFVEFEDLRHQFTHPKKAGDLTIESTVFDRVRIGWLWASTLSCNALVDTMRLGAKEFRLPLLEKRNTKTVAVWEAE